ncbi:MAG: methyltransferase domain-containing protein [Caulobacterales bacterium]
MVDAIYDSIGEGYALRRRTDPQIAAHLRAALGDVSSVINIGAGAGSYEPDDRTVLAIEPSGEMIRQRPVGAAHCIQATAEDLPVADQSFDAAMAVLTIHHWRDWRRGLQEMQRVAKSKMLLLTYDPDGPGFWLTHDYFPEIKQIDHASMPSLNAIAGALGGFQQSPVCIPFDCTDGFLGAYWRRPAAYLDPSVRKSISCFSRFDAAPGLRRLQNDLGSGAWANRNAALLALSELDIGYRLLRWTL